MANAAYTSFKEGRWGGASYFDVTTEAIQCALVDLADYTFSAAHDFFDDVNVAGAVEAATLSSALSSKTFTGGVFDAANGTWSAVSGDQCEAVVIYRYTGVDATSNLMFFLDTGVTGLPVTPNGADINLNFNASGIAEINW